MILKNLNANIPVSLSLLVLPFLAILCFAATAQFTDSSLYWPNEGSLAFAEKLNWAIRAVQT